jgi:hypothetical protein
MNTTTKTRSERVHELEALLATPVGRMQLRDLKAKYESETNRSAVVGKSIIDYIVSREKDAGLVVG